MRFREVLLELQQVLGIGSKVLPVVAGVVVEACLEENVDGIGQDLGGGVGIGLVHELNACFNAFEEAFNGLGWIP